MSYPGCVDPAGDPLPPKACHRAYSDIEVTQGNHSVSRSVSLGATAEPPLVILHFPIRSYSQFEMKIRRGGAAYARNAELPEEVGYTWRRLHRLLLDGQLREYYESQVSSPEKIRTGLAEGNLVEDQRLRRALNQLL